MGGGVISEGGDYGFRLSVTFRVPLLYFEPTPKSTSGCNTGSNENVVYN